MNKNKPTHIIYTNEQQFADFLKKLNTIPIDVMLKIKKNK